MSDLTPHVTISLSDISLQKINCLKQNGYCYVKINQELELNLMRLSEVGHQFFNQAEKLKQLSAFTDEKQEGFQNCEEKNMVLQRYAYRGGQLSEPLLSEQLIMDKVKEQLKAQVASALIKEMFEQGGISKYCPELLNNCSPTLVYSYYKYSFSGSKNKFVAHKDITLLTMIFSSEPGLEVFTDGMWHSIEPKSGHIVLMIGKILEVITGREYSSVLHRVSPPLCRDRLSVSVYLKLDPHFSLVDYKNNKYIHQNQNEYVKENLQDGLLRE
jgi:hypothetical protein